MLCGSPSKDLFCLVALLVVGTLAFPVALAQAPKQSLFGDAERSAFSQPAPAINPPPKGNSFPANTGSTSPSGNTTVQGPVILFGLWPARPCPWTQPIGRNPPSAP